jgi:hypothetical protein
MVTLHGVQLLEDSAYAITEHATRIGQGLAQAADALGRKAVEELRVFANDLGLTEVRNGSMSMANTCIATDVHLSCGCSSELGMMPSTHRSSMAAK